MKSSQLETHSTKYLELLDKAIKAQEEVDFQRELTPKIIQGTKDLCIQNLDEACVERDKWVAILEKIEIDQEKYKKLNKNGHLCSTIIPFY